MDIKIKDNSQLRLAAFTQLEYIKSTGTQYIDTGVLQSAIKKYELVWMGDANSVPTLGGKSGGWGYNDSLISYLYAGNNIYYSSGNGNSVRLDGVTGVKYTEIYNDGTLSVNRQTGNIGTLQKNVSLTIFYGGGRYGNGKIYSMKIYDHSMNLIRDFLPVKDYFGVVCLYDNVSQTFFYNKGTGNFTAGPVVKHALPENILLKTITLYHKNTPNVSGRVLLNSILNAQEAADDVVLNRIRVDIGNVSGSLSELMQYAGIAGFNDNYEPQAKPRLVGMWTINDWYTQEQLAEAQAAFDGLTVIGDPNYLIDFNELAVQVLNPNEDNYNPAVAIILQGQNLGTTMSDAPLGYGRWFITKTQAASTSVSTYFTDKNSVTDSNLIVSEDALSYYFREFNEFRFFNGIGYQGFYHSGISSVIINERLTTIGNLAFGDCGNLEYVYIPSNVTSILNKAFRSNKANGIKRINCTTPPSITIENTITPNTTKIIVGVGNYYIDKDVVEKFLSTAWSAYSSQIQSCYNYYAPQISYVDGYITITTQENSIIYYTTDGSTPTEQSTQYNNPFEWDGTGVIKAVSKYDRIMDNFMQSLPFYAQTCINPTFTVDSTNNQVIISCATPGAVIHYTIDGSYPTLDSPIYSAPITSQEDILKVRCFATKEGMNDSDVVSKICVLDDSLWGTDSETSSFAVQCMDSTKPNYNPAVCIILDNNGKLTDKCYGVGGYLTKTGAAAITTDLSSIFSDIQSSVTDTKHIVDDNNLQYNLISLNELKYFTGITSFDYIGRRCKHLESIEFPNSVISLGTTGSIQGVLAENRTGTLNHVVFSTNLTTIKNFVLTNSRYIDGTNSPLEIPENVTTIGYGSFSIDVGGINYGIHLNSTTPPTISSVSLSGNYKIYVGDGSSAAHDDAILADYLADTNWSTRSSMLDTWYNYLHPTT